MSERERQHTKGRRVMRRSATHQDRIKEESQNGKSKDDNVNTIPLSALMNTNDTRDSAPVPSTTRANNTPANSSNVQSNSTTDTRTAIQIEKDAEVTRVVKALKAGKISEVFFSKVEIDDIKTKMLLDAIPNCDRVKRITFRQNSLSSKNATELVRNFCRYNPYIKSWTIRENDKIESRTLEKIVKMMVEPTFGVLEIDLGQTAYGGDEIGIGYIEEVLKENKLTGLNLEGCPLGPVGSANLMEALIKNTSVKKLYIGGTEFDVGTLCTFLKKSEILSELSLANTPLKKEHFALIASCLSFERPLTILDLSYTGLDVTGLAVLARGIGNNSCIKQLRLVGNTFGDGWADAILPGLHEDMTELNISYCGLSSGLGKIISNTKLKRLETKGNPWSLAEFSAISEALTVNKTLLYLGLARGRGLSADELSALAGGLSVNTALTELDLAANGIQDDAAKNLLVAVQVNRSLRKLRLVYNLLSPKVMMAFEKHISGDTQALNKNEFIEVVDFIVEAHTEDPRWAYVNTEDVKKRKKLLQSTIEETIRWINTNSKRIYIRRKELQEIDKKSSQIAAVTVWSPPGEARVEIPKEKILLKLTVKGATGTANRYNSVINSIDAFIRANCSDEDWQLVFCEVKSKAAWDDVLNVVFKEADERKANVWTCVTDQQRIPLLKVFGFEVTQETSIDGQVKLWGLTRVPKRVEEALPARHRPSSPPMRPTLADSSPTKSIEIPFSELTRELPSSEVKTPSEKERRMKRVSAPTPSKSLKKRREEEALKNTNPGNEPEANRNSIEPTEISDVTPVINRKKQKFANDDTVTKSGSAPMMKNTIDRKTKKKTKKMTESVESEISNSPRTDSDNPLLDTLPSTSDTLPAGALEKTPTKRAKRAVSTNDGESGKRIRGVAGKVAAIEKPSKSPLSISEGSGAISGSEEGDSNSGLVIGNSISGQSLYSTVLTTAKTVLVNCNRVNILCVDSIYDILDGKEVAVECLGEVVTNLNGLSEKMDNLINIDLLAMDEGLYNSVEAESSDLDVSLKAMLSFLCDLQSKTNSEKYKTMNPQERSNLVKKVYVSVNSSIKQLITALEREKLSFESKDSNIVNSAINNLGNDGFAGKDIRGDFVDVSRENISDNSASTTTSVSEAPGPNNSVLTSSQDKEKITRPTYNFTPTKTLEEYDQQKLNLIQDMFKKNVKAARWRNLAKALKENKTYPRAKLRYNVIFELLSTEETYVKALETVIEFFLKPLREKSNSRRPLANKRDVTSLFSSIEIIYSVNIEFVKKLRERLKLWPTKATVGDLLNEALPAMKLYIDYVNNFNEATQTYQTLALEKEFSDFMEECKKKSGSTIDLPSLLITPVQRMPRYELLIRELIKSTDECHSDFNNLGEAKKIIEKTNKTINAKKQEQETRRKLYEIEKSIVSHAPMMLLAPHRLYIRDGPLAFTHKGQLENSGHVFLMNDIILLTKLKMERDKNGNEVSKFVYVTTISVSDMVIKDSGKKLQFYVQQSPEIWEFYCSDEQNKREWTTAVGDAIETSIVNEMLKAGVDDSGAKAFSILKASFGILKDPTQVADVTQVVQDIVKQQGGTQLVLNAGSKASIFGNPSKNSKKKQLMLVFSVKGTIHSKLFMENDAIRLPAESN